jgi:hypothetical protein
MAAAVALSLAALVGGASAPPAAAAWTAGACPTTAGVTVVVDFTGVGGGTVTRCAPSAPDSGLAALAAAGLAVEQVSSMPGFVCRIDGRPTAAEEACLTTPPADAYWSYWRAERGGSWAYNQVGPAATRPAAGSVEGWAFVTTSGAAQPPGVPPPPPPVAAATPRPTPRPTGIPTPAAVPAVTTSPATPPPSQAASVLPTVDPTPSPTAAATQRPTPPASREPAVSSPLPPDPPSPIGTMVGLGVVLAVAAVAVLVRRSGGLRLHG